MTTASLGVAIYHSPADSGSIVFTGGSNGIATITSASAYTGLTNNFTVEAWYLQQGNEYRPRILSTGQGSDGFCFGSWTTNVTKWKVTKYGVVDLWLGSVPQDTNVWHQVVLVYSSTAGTSVYVDGVLSETDSSALGKANIRASATPTVTIGKVENVYHKGLISTVRWYNRVLSDAEILQNYQATSPRYATNPVVSNLVLYLDPSNMNSIQSSNGYMYNLQPNGLFSTMLSVGHTIPSNYTTYNGTSSTMNFTDSGYLEPGSSSFSIEIWAYYSTINPTGSVLCGKTDLGGLASNWGYGIRTNAGGDTYFEVGNGTTSITSPSYTVSTGQWYQIVGVWTNGATKTIDLYVNGAKVGTSVTHAFASVKNTTRAYFFGSYNGGEYSQYFNGRMGVIRQYSSALSAAEVLQNYNNDRGLYGL